MQKEKKERNKKKIRQKKIPDYQKEKDPNRKKKKG